MKTIRDTSKAVSKLFFNEIQDIDLNYCKILEPSAGNGDLLDNVLNLFNATGEYAELPNSKIDCVETNDERRNNLTIKGYSVIGKDFLTHQFNTKYNLILACPPFKNGIDMEHITKMYDVLNDDNGLLVTLTHPRWITDNANPECVEFRRFLNQTDYKITLLPDNSFMEKGKSAPTAMIIIVKS